ncbi:two-component system CheB/CheR fusion protein [Paraburkholderia sp. BL8N3]|nr:CheR family methyltransferase [Paraburkholderia sp. BL8N3]TCK32786.1 two-component system CheB/CheR fusion protein [Paraburkholderia sp. BL8N3]
MTVNQVPHPSDDQPDASRPVQPSPDFPIIGIGASAGGIQALMRFFEHMPSDAGMAFVIVLHLSPKHESQADAVLQRATKMPVIQVLQPTQIEKNHIFLISPATDLSLNDGYLSVKPSNREPGRPVAIDLFFRSLAEVHGTRAISVILSGFGSDGTVGMARIKEHGGVTIAQSPEDAEYDEMPRNAIATGLVDIALPVADIPQKLVELRNNARAIQLPPAGDDQPVIAAPAAGGAASDTASPAEDALQRILATLRARTGHDFRHYKRATVLRRIERRLQVNALRDLPSYRRFLDTHPDESDALLKDMLIGVTNFFRDRDAFEALERQIVPRICEDKAEDDSIRVWAAGCSTGEEAYSLAMLLNECVAETNKSCGIQVFATDIDESAIETARTGNYPAPILTDVPPARLRKYFTLAHGRYVINKSLREQILFAAHNLLRDPPFSRLDLVSCRNLLIYLDRTVQRQVLQTFHFALQPGGYLFLGNSESAEIADDLFGAIDKKNRIYRAKTLATARTAPVLPVNGPLAKPTHFGPVKPVSGHETFSFAALHQSAVEHYAPPSVLIDRDGEILHMSEQIGRFLRYVGGEPSHNLLTLINPDLRLELRTAFFQALRHGKSVDAERVRFARGTASSYVNMTVRPFHDAAGGDVLAVFFDEAEETTLPEAPEVASTDESPIVAHLEAELRRTKELLQSTVEHSNVSSEELKASNEELQAINEEMRSASEELETSKEELQSVNEELLTVNGALQAKVEETAKANDDLQNLIASTGIATIFVDRAMRIKRYTPSAVALFNLIETDIGRPLLDLTHRLNYPELAADARGAFEDLKLAEREVSTIDGNWFLSRVLPYRTLDDRIDGAVLTLIDITKRRRAEAAARSSEERLKLAALTTDDYAIIVQDPDGTILSWNRGAQRMFGFEEKEVVGKSIDLIFVPEDRANGAAIAERETAKKEGRAEDERWHRRKDGSKIYCSGVMTSIETAGFKGLAKIARDLTDRKSVESQQQLQLALERAIRAQAETVNRQKDEFFAVLSHELKNPLNLIHVKAELLSRSPEVRDIALVQDAADAIQRSVLGQSKIIDDLLDLSRVRTGKLALHLSPVDLASVLRAIVEASEAEAANKQIRMSASGVDARLTIQADPVRLEQMIWNVVRNALKFTPHGGRVSVSLTRDDRFVCIEVCDSGLGIAPDFLPKVFDMFSQADGGGRRDRGGLGIGLSLTKQLVEMHGGRIEGTSAGLGQGACFRLWLPHRPSTSISRPSANADPRVLKGLRVLLVDDSLDGLEGFRTLLELEGAQVRAESSPEAALVAATESEFDLILSDIGMPTMSGYELIAKLRELPTCKAVPAIALTGFGREQDAVEALRAGFDAHLGKPVSLSALLVAIGSNLAKK